jgi:uncharacterized protein YbaP (TraB family)
MQILFKAIVRLIALALAVPALAWAQTGAAGYDPTQPARDAKSAPKADDVPPSSKVSSTKAFLWEVKSATATTYLFGTIHVGKKSFYPLPPVVEKAFNDSAKVVVEADISDTKTAAEVAAMVMYLPPDALEQKLPAPLYARLKSQLNRLKIPVDAVKTMKPYMVGGLLSIFEYARMGYDASYGVDAYLIDRAAKAGKPLLELESQLSQIKLLDAMSPSLQVAFLENSVEGLEAGITRDQVTGMVNAWQTGDEALMLFVNQEMTSGMRMKDEFDEILLYRRNADMLKKIDAFLAGNDTCFIAVGSLHLVGKRGLIEMLKNKGYQVRQL